MRLIKLLRLLRWASKTTRIAQRSLLNLACLLRVLSRALTLSFSIISHSLALPTRSSSFLTAGTLSPYHSPVLTCRASRVTARMKERVSWSTASVMLISLTFQVCVLTHSLACLVAISTTFYPAKLDTWFGTFGYCEFIGLDDLGEKIGAHKRSARLAQCSACSAQAQRALSTSLLTPSRALFLVQRAASSRRSCTASV